MSQLRHIPSLCALCLILQPNITAMIVSHDSAFLDATVTDIYHYENRRLRRYKGNLSEFVKVRPPTVLNQHRRAPCNWFPSSAAECANVLLLFCVSPPPTPPIPPPPSFSVVPVEMHAQDCCCFYCFMLRGTTATTGCRSSLRLRATTSWGLPRSNLTSQSLPPWME